MTRPDDGDVLSEPDDVRPEDRDASVPTVEPDPDAERARDSEASSLAADHDPLGLDVARLIARGAKGSGRQSSKPAREVRDAELSGAHPDARDPQRVGKVLSDLIGDRGWKAEISVHSVLSTWPRLVGDINAAHAVPESFDDGVLVVRADSTVWAKAYRDMVVPALLARLRDELGEGIVTKIVVRGPHAPTWKKGRRSVKGRGPRDTYG